MINRIFNIIKSNYKLIGRSLSLIALYFLFITFKDQFSIVSWQNYVERNLFLLLTCTSVWTAGCLLLALSWHQILKALQLEADKMDAVRIYSKSQIGKYLPGNIFQFLSRQILSADLGYQSERLIKTYVWEISLLILGALCFIPLILISNTIPEPYRFLLVLLPASVLSVCIRFIFNPHLQQSFHLVFLFHFITGLIFYLVLAESTHSKWSSDIFYISGSYITSWLIGFVSIGSPAGIGVRELVNYKLLESQFLKEDILLALLSIRIISISADLLTYILAEFAMKKKSKLP